MILSRLRLENFRNYSRLDISLPDGMTVLRGTNGQGKTNFLEAIYFLSLLRSFRTRKTAQLIKFEKDYFRLEGVLLKDQKWLAEDKLTVFFGNGRELLVNRRPVGKASLFINQFLCVALTPHDLELVRGAPKIRRRFCDILGAQIFPSYLQHLISYHHVLRQRNELLRSAKKFPDSVMTAYDQLLAEHAAEIIIRRHRLIEKINFHLRSVCRRLKFDDQPPSIDYRLSIDDIVFNKNEEREEKESVVKQFLRILAQEKNRDQEQGHTRCGPHRDDLFFTRGGKSVAAFASAGQCRLCVSALKLAAAETVRELQTEKPLILLVDDVYGDLDARRRQDFFQTLADYRQIIMAGTEIPVELAPVRPTVMNVNEGVIEV